MKISDNYKTITDLIDSAQLRGADIVSFIDQMGIDLSNSEIPSGDINRERLESNINVVSNRLSSNNVSYTIQLLSFVVSLQKYITDKYGSVDDFLSDNSIKVKSTFAAISEAVGYIILPTNISDVS